MRKREQSHFVLVQTMGNLQKHLQGKINTDGRMGIPVPDGPDGEVAVRAAGSRAGAGIIDVGHQRVGRGADHGLQVDAGIRDRRDGQRSLPAHPRRQSGTGETGHWREKTLFSLSP